ncbi:MAG: hypothetical protein M3328_16425 [Chloroflexota bacterium]|nr:hypothetical protein [Chloroflexota bacterium]
MRKLFGGAIAFALTLSVMPAVAGDVIHADRAPATFHALSQLPVGDRAALTPLSADELAAIVGGNHTPTAFVFTPVTPTCGECGAPGASNVGAGPGGVGIPLLRGL